MNYATKKKWPIVPYLLLVLLLRYFPVWTYGHKNKAVRLRRLQQEDLELEASWDVPSTILSQTNENRLFCGNAVVWCFLPWLQTPPCLSVFQYQKCPVPKLSSCVWDILEVELVIGRKCMVDTVFMATLSFKKKKKKTLSQLEFPLSPRVSFPS